MRICITGPMAAGKNAASSILEELGFKSVDADQTAHVAIENQKEAILKKFGPIAEEKKIDLLNGDGTVNRRNLGAIVFTSPDLIKAQEDIVYPEINRILGQFQAEYHDSVINATVLYKVPLINSIDLVIFVDCPSILRFFRARKRDRMPFKQIIQRFHAQKNLFAKYKNSNADTLRVWNIGSRKALKAKLKKILSRR